MIKELHYPPRTTSEPHFDLRLSLLGAWNLATCDGPIEVGRNAQRLFALLGTHGPCERSYVAGVLWPQCSDTHANGNLRATLSRLHQRSLRGALQSANGALSMSAAVDVDVNHLLRAASNLLDGSSAAPDRMTLHKLNGDDLLVGWYDDWVLRERERLRQIRLRALEALSLSLLASGDTATAVEAALATVAIEPLRESAHGTLIRAHLAEGNRAEALQHLTRLRLLLHVELGVEPSRQVVELLRR
jgi:DNA-binding SARP family transcriptional activator